jgi:hypothetical protein
MSKWSDREVAVVGWTDERHRKRMSMILSDFAARPEVSIPQACRNWSRTKGVYRFFCNPRVDVDQMFAGHRQATIARCSEHHRILAVQDTTELNYSHHPGTRGLGTIGNPVNHGMMVHTLLAVATDGVPLGVLNQEVWTRDPQDRGKAAQRHQRAIHEKESQRWLTGLQQAQKLIPPETQVVVVGDRESDLFDLFAVKRDSHAHLLVRVRHRNRAVEGCDVPLESCVLAQPAATVIEREIPTKTGSRFRLAKLEVRWAALTIQPPSGNGEGIPLSFVSLREADPPSSVSEPIDWLLATSFEIARLEEALELIDWYCCRWRIEEYHRTLKTGCRIEESQLEEADRLRKLLVCYSIVSWRLLWLTYEARKSPTDSCERVLKRAEWEVLCVQTDPQHRLPTEPPTLSAATSMIGRLGGHLGRKGDGPPGTQSLWRGLMRLQDLAIGWQAHQQFQNPSVIPTETFG